MSNIAVKYNGMVTCFGKYFLGVVCVAFIFAVGCSKDKENLETAPDIALNKTSVILEKGKSERLIASFTPADTPNKGHVWSSSAPNVAGVDETGMVTAVGLGESIITVTALNGKKTATCRVTVTDKIVKVTDVSLNENEVMLVAGDKLQLEATITPENATDKSVVWSSSDNKVASVDGFGAVIAIAEGKTVVTVMTNDGEKSASCKISVRGKGVEISKPEVSDITSISAFVTGTIQVYGLKIQERGICYSTSQSPTVDDKKVVLSGNEIAYTLTGLEPETTYYTRIYALVDGTAKYGDQVMFTTEVPAEISEPKISSITTHTAYIEGTIKTFGLQADETGICYSTSPMPTIEGTKVVLSGTNIAYTLNELIPETTYYVRVYAKIRGKLYYGDQGTFATTGMLKTHFEPTDIYEDKITLVSPGISGVTSLKVCYGTSPHPKLTDNTTTAIKHDDGKLYLNLTGLQQGTTYYIRAYSRNGANIEYFDNEVAVQTVGGDFKVQNKATRYFYLTEGGTGKVDYCIDFQITYDIKLIGTYLVETVSGIDFIKKNASAPEFHSIYIENGTGNFIYMMTHGEYLSYNSMIQFRDERVIKFTNLDNNICYYISVGKLSWNYSLWF